MKKLIIFGLLLFLPFDIICQNGIVYTNFKDSKLINLFGDANIVENKIRLTPADTFKVGTIWFKEKQFVNNGFTILFNFQITDLGLYCYSPKDSILEWGADGFAFVIQNFEEKAIGLYGAGIGYKNIPNSLAIEFDTYDNTFLYNIYKDTLDKIFDPNNNHIAIQSLGKNKNSNNHKYSLALNNDIPNMSDGNLHLIKINYKNNIFNVYLDDMINSILSLNIKLDTLLNLDNGKAWLGFTASTGGSYENHDILDFNFFCPEATIYSENNESSPGDSLSFPILLNNATILKNLNFDTLKTELYFDINQFYPLENSFKVNNDKYFLDLELPLNNISDTLKTVKFITLLNNEKYDSISKLEFQNSIIRNSNINVCEINPEIHIGKVCAQDLRRVQFFNPTTFTIQPNPANSNEIEIKFEGDEEGIHSLNFYNIQGIKIDSKEWLNAKKGKKDLKFDLKDYPNGVYYVVLKSPWNVISKPLMVIK